MRRERRDGPATDNFAQYEPSKRHRSGPFSRTQKRWSVPESHINMPQVIRQEVRDFH